MLEYNPGFRPTAKDIIKNPYFDSIRNKTLEVDAPRMVHQKMHLPGVLDYERLLDTYRISDYRKMLREEVESINPPNVVCSPLKFVRKNLTLPTSPRLEMNTRPLDCSV